jgi:tape measure domain-containing protein
MAQPAANLRVRISADLADIKQGLGLLRGELAKVKRESAAALGGNQNAFTSGIRRARVELAAFVGVFLSLRGVSLLGGIADEATQIRGRVKAAKGDYQALLALAQETRTGLNSTVDLYTRMERSTRSQNISQERLLTVTKAINQAIKLSYATAGAGDAAITQLGQGLASGTLRGEELNSVIEQTPRLAEAIAAGMGKPLGALRDLAKQGKLTSSEVIKALENQAAALQSEYQAVPVTIKDALTQIRNSFVDYIGQQDAATGSSKRFAAALQGFAKDLPRLLDPLLSVLALLLRNFEVLAVFFITRMAAAAIPALINGFIALRAAIVATTASAVTLRGALALLGGPIGIAIAALAAGIYYLYQKTTQAQEAQKKHNTDIEQYNLLAGTGAAQSRKFAEEKRKEALATLANAKALLIEQQARLREDSSDASLAGDRGAGRRVGSYNVKQQTALVAELQAQSDAWAKKLVELAMQASDEVLASAQTSATATVAETGKAVAASNALLRDSIARALKELDRLYEAQEIGIAEYFATRQDLQEKAIDADIEQARAELAVTKEVGARRKIEEDIIKLQRDRAEVGVAGAREQKKAEEDLEEQLANVKVKLLELDGETGRAARVQLETEYAELFKRLDAASDETGRKMVENLIERLVSKAQLDQIRDAAGKITGALQGTETSLEAQMQVGMLGQLEGERQLQAAREAALQKMYELRQAAYAALEEWAPGSPQHAAALAGIQELDTNIANITASMQKYRQQVADAAVNSVSNLFMDLVEGSKSAGEALRDFVRGFALAMAQIAARALATYLVLQLLDAIYPGLGKATAATMSVGAAHNGGVAGKFTMTRHNINPMVFGAAPRYHDGGVAGLRPGEVPAILMEGERIRTEEQEAALQARLKTGSNGTVVKQPIVAIGDRAVSDAMSGSAGEDVILTHVRNNWEALTRGS